MNKLKYLKMIALVLAACGVCFAGNNGQRPDGSAQANCPGGNNGCISFNFVTGPMKNHISAPSGSLGVISDDPSPLHSTPQALSIVTGTFGIIDLDGRELKMKHNFGAEVQFAFPEGSGTGLPQGDESTWKMRMKMVDANENIVIDNPVYFDLYTYEELERARFCADPNSSDYLQMLEYRTADGRVENVEDYGMDFIYDGNGVIRQAKAPTRMLDIVTLTPYNYEVRYYDIQDVSTNINANGVYDILVGATPFETWMIDNPDTTNAYNRLNISREVGGTVRTMAFEYFDALKMWQSTRDGGETFEQSTMIWNVAETAYTRTESDLSINEDPVSKEIQQFVVKPWGRAVVEEEHVVSLSPDISQKATYTYYEDSAEPGRYTRKHTVQNFDGTWSVFDYDSEGRQTVEVSSWLDVSMTTAAAQAKATYYDYVPHETGDVPMDFDERPRTVTEKIEGIVTKKTYHVYKFDGNVARIAIKEECVSQNAVYGDPANLRTVKNFYGPNDGALLNGRLKTIEYPDGRMDTYEHELGTLYTDYATPENSSFTVDSSGLDWRVTTIHGTATSPDGVANKSTKEVWVEDEYSNLALKENHVYNGTDYNRIQWVVREFDVYGHAVETFYSDGTQESGYWGTGCCGKDNGTDRQGIETAYTYDLNKRMLSSTKKGYDGTADIVTTYNRDAKRRLLTTTRAAGSLSLSSTNRYDMVGRIIEEVDESGLVTSYSSDDVNRIETKNLPGGGTIITSKYRDGQIKSITGSAVTHEYYTNGVEYVDGEYRVWAKKYVGPNGLDSKMWEKATFDLMGRRLRFEKPGFSTTSNLIILLTEYHYNNKNQLDEITESTPVEEGVRILQRIFEYDAMGANIRNGVDVELDGTLTTTSKDRIIDIYTEITQDNGHWYELSSETTYIKDNSALALTNFVTKTRLTGLGEVGDGSVGKLTSEVINLDSFGNITIKQVYNNRSEKTETSITDVPTSSIDQVSESLNGLLQSKTSESSVVKNYEWDDLGRQSAVRSESNSGNRSVASIFEYNSRNQIEWFEDEAGNRTEYAYDLESGRLVSQMNSISNVTYYAYDFRGNVTNEWGATYSRGNRYDDYGRLIKIMTYRDEAGYPDVITIDYDEATGVLTNKLYANGMSTAYEFTPDKRFSRRTWARTTGSPALPLTSDFLYDALGQLTNINYSSDDTSDVTFTYNRTGNKTSVIDAVGTREFSYDETTGALTNEAISYIDGAVTNYWDLSLSRDSYGRPGGYSINEAASFISYGYDALGRFSTIAYDIAGETNTFSYSWMGGANLLNGYSVPLVAGDLEVAYGYEANRNYRTSVLNAVVENGGSGTTNLVSGFDYIFDAHGRCTRRIDATLDGSSLVLHSTNTFNYNVRDEVTMALSTDTGLEQYQYDDIGNRELSLSGGQQHEYVANQLNQYTGISNVNQQVESLLAYDDDGNLSNDGVWNYVWDAENRLIAAESSSLTNQALRVEFDYDYMGRRFKKVVYAWDTSSSQWNTISTYSFVYNGWNLIHETVTDNQSQITVTNSYLWGVDLSQSFQGAGGIGALLTRVATSSSSPTTICEYYCYEGNGNVSALIDSSDGSVGAQYAYDSFGRSLFTGYEGNPFRFSTKYYDAEINTYYYGLRYYSLEMGRWLSRDPLGTSGGLNIYAFVGNNPVNFIDPLGLTDVTFISPSGGNQKNFNAAPNGAEGVTSVEGHGDAAGNTVENGNNRLDGTDAGNLAAPNIPDGNVVVLYVCNAGCGTFGQDFANATGNVVLAPNGYVDPNGNVWETYEDWENKEPPLSPQEGWRLLCPE